MCVRPAPPPRLVETIESDPVDTWFLPVEPTAPLKFEPDETND